jgi:hypothetical protein
VVSEGLQPPREGYSARQKSPIMDAEARAARGARIEAVSQELPVTLADGVVRVGSSYALAGVPALWTPFAPVAEARYAPPAGSCDARTR